MNVLVIAAVAWLLYWPPPPAAEEVDSFQVHRIIRALPGDTLHLATVADTFFLDTRVQPNVRYIYIIRSVRNSELGPWSNDVSGAAFSPQAEVYEPADTFIMFRTGAFTSKDALIFQCQALPLRVDWNHWGGLERITVDCIWNNWGTRDFMDLSDVSGLPPYLWDHEKVREAFSRYYNRRVRFEGVIE